MADPADLDVLWSQLEGIDMFWFALYIAAAVGPFIAAYMMRTELSLAMILSLMFVMFLRFFSETTGLVDFNEIHFFAMYPAIATEGVQFYRFVSAAWLHSDWIHVLSNLMVIGLVGIPLEQRLGGRRWIAVYFLGLLGGNLAWVAAHPGSFTPAIGASGAAFGILGAYMACWPNDEVEFPLLFLIRAWPIWLITFVRLGLELYQMYAISAGNAEPTNIAHLAHVGGFFLAYIFARPIARGAPSELDSVSSGSTTSGDAAIKQAKSRMGSLDDDPWSEAEKPLHGEAARILSRLRKEGDELETRQAWLEELSEHVICPVCDGEVKAEIKGDLCTLRCVISSNHIRWP